MKTMKAYNWQNAEEKLAAFNDAKFLADRDPREFWAKEAARIFWQEPFHEVHNGEFASARWFSGGKLNVSENCLDAQIAKGLGDKKAIIWENEAGESRQLTYHELLVLTKDIATILHEAGVGPGDRVAIYMPMIPEGIASLLAVARLGAIHTVIFGGFAKESLVDRIIDAEAKVIITADFGQRRGQKIGLQKIVNEALQDPRMKGVGTVLCFGSEVNDEPLPFAKTVRFKKPKAWPPHVEKPLGFPSEHPLFILYTSGTTGKPKGLFHTSGGYLVNVVATMAWVFDIKPSDVYWCTADIGWITGHSYVTYGPLASGATIFIFDGALNWPTQAKPYQMIEKYGVTIFYTSPTAIRMLMSQGDRFHESHNLSSLRLLGSVGEPINQSAWHWYHDEIGQKSCPVVDTWWQTETGAMMIAPIPHVNDHKPASASKPLLGVSASIVDEKQNPLAKGQAGFLIIDKPWPSMARGIWGDQERFLATYFAKFPGAYFCGDGARVDHEGDFFITGRIDDVVNVSGHRLSTAEIESALGSHQAVAEVAVVGVSDELTGQKLVAFVVVRSSVNADTELASALSTHVGSTIGSFAKPKTIQFVKGLPKTRSGKIMRRLLRAVANGESVSTDTSTLEDQSWLSPK
jgi:acetyl-CoA synthetase